MEPVLKCPLRSVFIICSQECSSVMLAAVAAAVATVAGGGVSTDTTDSLYCRPEARREPVKKR